MSQCVYDTSLRPGPFPEPPKPCPTAGRVFPDGSMLELVRDPSNPHRLMLLHWEHGRSAIARQFIIAGRRYAPVVFADPLLTQLRLPSKTKPYGSTMQLFNEARALLAAHSDLTESDLSLLTYFVSASFFNECVPIAPCLLISGPRAEATALLRMLGWMCRHPILLADVGPYELPAGLKPTRLVCQSDARIEKLLAPLQLPGFGISRSGSLHDICGATAIYHGDEDLESTFADGCLRISVAPSRTLLSMSDERRESTAIATLQNKFLTYRIRNFRNVRNSDFDVPEFSGPTRELARSLGACIVDEPELRARLVALLQPHDDVARSERIPSTASTLLEILLMRCHERRASAYVGEVAKEVNELFARRHDLLRLSARETGGQLKSLGFHTVRLDAGGRGLRFGPAECVRIHSLAHRYGAPALGDGLPACPYCQQICRG